jgi:hypothetical protein
VKRNLSLVIVFALLIAAPVFADVRNAGHPAAEADGGGLRLMNEGEFTLFLTNLDMGLLRWKTQMSQVSVESLGLDRRESQEMDESYNLCLKSLDNTREDVQKLSQKQTLQLDFLLLVDLSDLARNLDGFTRDMENATVAGRPATQKSLGYARTVLGIDTALAPHLAEFQRHILAFAKMIDAAMDHTEQAKN